jgi:hypothetical protein
MAVISPLIQGIGGEPFGVTAGRLSACAQLPGGMV